MRENGLARPPGPPWQRETDEKKVKQEPASKARTIHGLAAELKNEVRADRIRQAKRRRNPN